jgi:hypothetical protein
MSANILTAEVTYRLDAAGDWKVTMPVTDPKTGLIQRGDIWRHYREGEGLVFAGLIEDLNIDPNGNLEISGATIMGELLYKNVFFNFNTVHDHQVTASPAEIAIVGTGFTVNNSWDNPQDALACDDGNFAVCTPSFFSSLPSTFLCARKFHFSFSPSAVISGISVDVGKGYYYNSASVWITDGPVQLIHFKSPINQAFGRSLASAAKWPLLPGAFVLTQVATVPNPNTGWESTSFASVTLPVTDSSVFKVAHGTRGGYIKVENEILVVTSIPDSTHITVARAVLGSVLPAQSGLLIHHIGRPIYLCTLPSQSYGGTTEKWGASAIDFTAAEIERDDFGFGLAFQTLGTGPITQFLMRIFADCIKMTVYYNDIDTVEQSITNLLALADNWTLAGSAGGAQFSAKFDGDSVLRAILRVIEGTPGLHFRENVQEAESLTAPAEESPLKKQVEIGAFGTDSGYTLMQSSAAVGDTPGPLGTFNLPPNLAYIDSITVGEPLTDVWNVIAPIGAGQGAAQVTLRDQNRLPNLLTNPSFELDIAGWTNNAPVPTLTAAIDSVVTTFQISWSGGGNMPIAVGNHLTIDQEVMVVTAITGGNSPQNISVTRGFGGTGAVTHAVGRSILISAISTKYAVNGTASVLLSGGANGIVFSQDTKPASVIYDVANPHKYNIEAWLYPLTHAHTMKVTLKWETSAGATIGTPTDIVLAAGTLEWQHILFKEVTPPATASRLGVYVTVGAGDQVALDMVRAWESAKTATPTTGIGSSLYDVWAAINDPTQPLPAMYFYLQDDYSISGDGVTFFGFGRREKVVSETSISPVANTKDALTLASNALYDAAANYLHYASQQIRTYQLSVIGLPNAGCIQVGDQVTLRYRGVVKTITGSFTYLDTTDANGDDVKVFVLERQRTFSENGEVRDKLTVSSAQKGLSAPNATVVGKVVDTTTSLGLKVQPYPAVYCAPANLVLGDSAGPTIQTFLSAGIDVSAAVTTTLPAMQSVSIPLATAFPTFITDPAAQDSAIPTADMFEVSLSSARDDGATPPTIDPTKSQDTVWRFADLSWSLKETFITGGGSTWSLEVSFLLTTKSTNPNVKAYIGVQLTPPLATSKKTTMNVFVPATVSKLVQALLIIDTGGGASAISFTVDGAIPDSDGLPTSDPHTEIDITRLLTDADGVVSQGTHVLEFGYTGPGQFEITIAWFVIVQAIKG